MRIIDFPGHSRLRPQLFDMIEDCAALVFLIDASTFSIQARDIASFLLDLMTSEKMLKVRRRRSRSRTRGGEEPIKRV